MPLIKSKSKKALKDNMETEMMSGKDPKQSFAIAASVQHKSKSKNKKNYAEGGPVSAKTEKRPMPEQLDNSKAEANRNSGKKAPSHGDKVLEDISSQASKGKTIPLKQPKMPGSDHFQVKLRDQENDLQMSSSVNNGPQEQPPKDYDEEGPNRQGPSVPALDMKMMAEGGRVDHNAIAQQHLDMYKKHRMMAEGGMIDSMDQPEPEAELEHHDSLAAAIMSKRKKFAEGGAVNDEIDIMDNGKEIPNQYYGRNEEILKENYDADMEGVEQMSDSNLIGDDRESESENEHDGSIVSAIRSKMKNRRFRE